MKALRKAPAKKHFPASSTRRILSLENRHFLLVEEAPDRRQPCLELLEHAGAEVTLERHALTGVVVALSMPERFDALILDVKLPLLEIVEVGIALKSAGFDRPIIALVPELPRKAQRFPHQAGCNFIPKNSQIASVFVSMVNGLIRSTPAELN